MSISPVDAYAQGVPCGRGAIQAPDDGATHERQVAAAGNVQEVLEVDQGEARRQARQGPPRVALRADAPEQEAVSLLSLGVLGRSAKENEHRLPLHPDHLARLPSEVAARITL